MMQWVRRVFLICLVAGIGWYIAARWQELRLPEQFRWKWLAAGTPFMLGGFVAFARGQQLLLRDRGHDVSLPRSLALLYLPVLGKYVPGKVWSVVGAMWLFHQQGIPRATAATCIIATMMCGVAGGGLVSLAFAEGGLPPWMRAILMAASIVGLLLFIRSRLFQALSARVVRRWSHIAESITIGPATLLHTVVINAVAWTLSGLGFVCVVQTSHAVAPSDLPGIVAIFAFAQVMGFLALFAPAGIGVREGLLVAALAPLLGEGQAVLIAAVARLWQTLLELLLAAFGWCVLNLSQARTRSSSSRL